MISGNTSTYLIAGHVEISFFTNDVDHQWNKVMGQWYFYNPKDILGGEVGSGKWAAISGFWALMPIAACYIFRA